MTTRTYRLWIGALLLASVLPACRTEADPRYWVARLDRPEERANALSQIERRASGGANAGDDKSRRFRSDLGAPLGSYLLAHYRELGAQDRVRILRLLTEEPHPDVVRRTLDEFAKGAASVEELDVALGAAMKLPRGTLGGALVRVFDHFEASSVPERAPNVRAALLRHCDVASCSSVVQSFAEDIPQPDSVAGPDDLKKRQNRIFRQATAIDVLGAIGGKEAVEDLFRVLLEPRKEELHTEAILSLVRIGKPALDRAASLVVSDSDPLVEYARKHPPRDVLPELEGFQHVVAAATVLGELKRSEGGAPLLAALDSAKSPVLRVTLARVLTKVPATPKSIGAFERVYESLPGDALVPPGIPARQVLAEAAQNFLDPSLVPWLLSQVEHTAEADDPEHIRRNDALVSAIRLMTRAQLESVLASIQARKVQVEAEAFLQSAALLEHCKEQISCYVVALSDEANQEGKSQVTGVKAATMLAELGNETAALAILQRYDRIKSPVIRFAAALAVDHLTPKPSPRIQNELARLTEPPPGAVDSFQRDPALELVRFHVEARTGG